MEFAALISIMFKLPTGIGGRKAWNVTVAVAVAAVAMANGGHNSIR